jgi:hypothetical protein
MDVFLQDENAYAGPAQHASDFLYVDAIAGGRTGMIFRKTNPTPVDVDGYSEIQVVEVGAFTVGEDCVFEWCSPENTFFISPESDGYFESVNGVGFISDGLKSWGLYQTPGEDFYLATFFGGSPGAWNAPKVGTGVLNIADELFDIVYDHNYGYQFRPGGGGGADLPVEAAVYEEPAATGTQTGLWAKVTGSKIDRTDEVTDDGFTFEAGYDQDIYSILGGADFKWDPNSPIRLGLFGGYVQSNMDFDLGDGEVDYEGGVVGGYVAYNNGAFYADATVKAEFLANDYSFDGVDVSADSTSVGVSANTGYRIAMGGAFVEPLASVRYVHVSIDDFDTTDGSVTYDNPNSLRAGAGARIGVDFATGGGTTQLSLLGRAWNEFDGETEVTVENGVGTFTYSDDISGVYGEVEGQILVTSSDGTLSGFLSANGKFGDDFTSYGGKAGIRKGF